MIISGSRQFIFFHCRKAAGSSVVTSLSRYLGSGDLQLSGLQETLAHGLPLTDQTWAAAQQGARLPLTLERLRGKAGYRRAISDAVHRAWRDQLGGKPQHPPAARVRAAFPDLFESAFKFGVVRNPWDRAVSDYFWMTRNLAERPAFDAWMYAVEEGRPIADLAPARLHDNWPIYAEGDTVLADRMLRFETLVEDLRTLMQELGIPWDGWMPQAKSGFRAQGKSTGYRDVHTNATRAIVARLYAREIDLFGYQF